MKKFLLLLLIFSCTSQEGDKSSEIYVENGVAINGYDPVAYFSESKPVEGNAGITVQWQQATWRFSSEENKNAFESNPEKYAPVFGGYCAYGMSNGEGYKATTDPNAWTIVDGKLYLNYSLGVKEKWMDDQEARIEKAHQNWPRVRNDTEVKR